MPRTLVLAASDPLWERLIVAATGPLVTVLVGGLIVWAATRKIEQKREDRLREREESRQDAQASRELRARDDALRHELVTMMTDCASTLYLATQHVERLKEDLGADPDRSLRQAEYEEHRRALDQQYLKSRAAGQALEYRLGGYFTSDEPSRLWHGVQDLLTVRYFQVTDRATPALLGRSAGEGHSGLTEDELRQPGLVKAAYHATMHKAVDLVFGADLTARSEEQRPGARSTLPPGQASPRHGPLSQQEG